MSKPELYAHYQRYGIAEPYRHEAPDGETYWIARCKCGWESRWRFTEESSAEDDAAEHMRSMADER
jgi:hypothetical protein